MSLTNATLPMYQGTEGMAYQERHQTVPRPLYDIVSQARAEKFTRWITPKMRVFEFGVGAGFNLAQLPCRAKVGYDIAYPRWVAMPPGIQFRWDTESIRSGSFDAVICHHVLEHVTNPWNDLREMRRLLVPGGVLIVHVPFEFELRHRRFDPRVSNGHLFSWTPQTIAKLVTSSGFELGTLKVQRFGYDRFAAVVTARLGLGRQAYRMLRATLRQLRPEYEIASVFRKK